MDARTILIADDQQDIAEALALLLKHEGYAVDTARSPLQVLACLRERRYDLALVDMNYARDTTSGAEGLSLLDDIHELDRLMPVVVITGWSTVKLAVQAMQRGARDFIPKPWDNREVVDIVSRQVSRGSSERQSAQSQARRQVDLEAAGQVQRRLLPETSQYLSSLECAARCSQSEVVGGDYYDLLPLGRNRLVITIGDVAGKGMAAGLLMATVQSLVRNLSVQHDGDPAAVVTALNRSLLQCMPANRFATLFYGLFDDTNRTLSYVNAGHNPPFCVRRDGARERLTTGGMMVGVFADATFVASSTTLHPGDRVIAFTDGLSEATDAGGDQFGDERIADLIGLSPDLDPLTLIDLLLKTRDEFASAEGEPDDTTVVALRARA